MSRYLCVDLGTTTGFAVGSVGGVASGIWELKHDKRVESQEMRFIRFEQELDAAYRKCPFTLVVFEEVRRHAGTEAAHTYGGLKAILTTWCKKNGVAYTSVAVGTVKKLWTGKGNATKSHMMAEAERRGYDPEDDNEADSLAIMWWTLLNFEGEEAARQTMDPDYVLPDGVFPPVTKQAA